MICSAINTTIIRIPNKASAKKHSATVSSRFSLVAFDDRMEKNESRQERMSESAIVEVNSSTILVAERSKTCIDVITNRQKPNRFAAVLNICCDVTFAILQS